MPKKTPKKSVPPKKGGLARQAEKAMPGWKAVSRTVVQPRSSIPPVADARLPSMKDLRRKFLGDAVVQKDAPEPALTNDTESVDLEAGELKSRVWFNKGSISLKKG